MQAKVLLRESAVQFDLHIELPDWMWENYRQWKSWRENNPHSPGIHEWNQLNMDLITEEIRRQYKPENVKLRLCELGFTDILPV